MGSSAGGRPRIVVLDGRTLNPGDNPWDEVAALGDMTVYDRTPPELILDRSRDAGILLTNKTPLTRATLESLPGLRFVGVLATGHNVVDATAARERGIPVANVPEYGTRSVAQFVFALLLELCHRIGAHDEAVKSGEWSRGPDFCLWKTPQMELDGKSIGIVGFGKIGRAVGEIAHALGMAVAAADPERRNAPTWTGFRWAEVDDIFRSSDVVSLNCSLTRDNEGMVNAALLSTMKPTALLVNAARGPLVRERDLAEALKAGRPAGAAVDVVSSEPIRPDNPLLGVPSCIITPHMAWASQEARRRLMHTTAENVRAFLAGRPVNVVNP
jgi:glycerate dehydrogenase